MNLLILAVVSIIAYAEILPTIDLMFEYIRTWIVYKTALIQKKVVAIQEEEEAKGGSTHAIGFAYDTDSDYEEGEDEDE